MHVGQNKKHARNKQRVAASPSTAMPLEDGLEKERNQNALRTAFLHLRKGTDQVHAVMQRRMCKAHPKRHHRRRSRIRTAITARPNDCRTDETSLLPLRINGHTSLLPHQTLPTQPQFAIPSATQQQSIHSYSNSEYKPTLMHSREAHKLHILSANRTPHFD